MSAKGIFGRKLRFYRKEKRLSQEQLSEKVDISVKHLSAIERGLTFVSADLLEKLSKSLETPVHLFFKEETETFNSDSFFDAIDRKIEKHLIKAMEEIKAAIRQDGIND